MQETTKYAVGLDIGTSSVRCLIASQDATRGALSIVGVGEAKSKGVRKGQIVDSNSVIDVIDLAVNNAEQNCGFRINTLAVGINGSHIVSIKSDGMIALASQNHEIDQEDLDRLADNSITGRVPVNQEVLEVVPHEYRLDGQTGLRDVKGLTGNRLDANFTVVTGLNSYINRLKDTLSQIDIKTSKIMPNAVAAAKAVLTSSQVDNGVALVDIGESTTSVAIYEEDDLRYTGVVELGGRHITNDLAMGLHVEPEVAEAIKLKYIDVSEHNEKGDIIFKFEGNDYQFNLDEANNIVAIRLEEIFEQVQKILKKAGYAGKLPSGVVLVGGVANTKGITEIAKQELNVVAKVAMPSNLGGLGDQIEDPKYATVVGLMMVSAEAPDALAEDFSDKPGLFSKLFKRFK